MLRPFYLISIQQVPTETWKDRNQFIQLDFVHEYEVETGWEKHTDTATVKFPKNILLRNGKSLLHQSGTYNVIIGGSGAVNIGNETVSGVAVTISPLIIKGDVITIQSGYWFKNENHTDVQVGTTVFSGYVSKVNSTTPIEIECEDNFYLLKHTPVNKSTWPSTLASLCRYMVDQVNALFGGNNALNVNGVNPYPLLEFTDETDEVTLNFSLGHLVIEDETCSELLERVRSKWKLESFFVDNTLHFGFPIYSESRADSRNFFYFEDVYKNGKLYASANIFDTSSLEYKNKDDIVLSTIVKCGVITKTGKTTKDGLAATKRVKISVLVYWDIASESWKYHTKDKGQPFPMNSGGERHTCIYPISETDPIPSENTLFQYGIKQLEKYFYTGMKGSFTTFGFPFVKWGDNVNCVSNVFADRNGQYKIKKVKYKGGVHGLQQELFIHFKQQVKLPEAINKIFMI